MQPEPIPVEILGAKSHQSGESLFLEHLGTIERVIAFICRRNSLRDADAEDFGSWVKLKLIENGYAIILRFEGHRFAAYISTVIHRLLLDYRIQFWGKWHASAEARRHGEVGVALEVMLLRDGRTIEEALPALRRIRPDVTRKEAEALAAVLPARSPRARFVELDDAVVPILAAGSVEDVPLAKERATMWNRIADVLQAYLAILQENDRVTLRMRFGGGLTVAEIARTLRLEQKALYRRLDRHIDELRRRLLIAGINWEKARELLEHPRNELDFSFLEADMDKQSSSAEQGEE